MNKTETSILKGVAILLMVFYHLFFKSDNASLCADVMLFNNQSLLLWLANGSNPVAFFVILGGYGMYIVTTKGDKHRYSRIIKLYIHLWCTMGLFLIIGHCLFPNKYPGAWDLLLKNLIGYDVSYNNEYWFLFPYVILTLTCPWLFHLIRNLKAWKVICFSFLLTIIASFLISRYKGVILFQHIWLLQIIRYFNFMLAFMLGAMSAREGWIIKLRKRLHSSWITWILILVLYACRCSIHTNLINAPFAFIIIVLMLIAPRPECINRILFSFGSISMDIWFIHTWLCFYLFHDIVYNLHNPFLIMVCVLGFSYSIAWAINKFIYFIHTHLFTFFESSKNNCQIK